MTTTDHQPADQAVPTPAPTGSPTQPVIRVRDLRMSYGGAHVLHGTDLDIHRGEIFALLGPNGAGKTTTVEILEGFRQRSAGEVAVLGTDPARGDDAWRARIGLVLQSWRDHRRWQVAELLTHFATYYPRPRDPAELLAPWASPSRTASRSTGSPAASAAVWTSHSPSSAAPNSSSWTSRRPASTPRPGATSTIWSNGSPATRASRSCSPHTIWPRPSGWPTG